MAVISGVLFVSASGGLASNTPGITPALRQMTAIVFPPVGVASLDLVGGAVSSDFPVSMSPRALSGVKKETYLDDLYYKIHVIPAGVVGGNVVTDKEVQVKLWNAHLSSRTLSAITFTDATGVSVESEALPWVMMPLREYDFTFTFTRSGDPVIDGAVLFNFNGTADDKLLPVTAQRVTAWTTRPDWSAGIVERLEWMTDVIRSYDGSEQRIALRALPRRSFEFDYLVTTAAERRRLENILFAWGSMPWAVPIWTDCTALQAPLSAGATSLPIQTATSDYHVGGLAIILGESGAYEVVGVASVTGSSVTLEAPTVYAWPAGTSIFPARLGVLDSSHKVNRFTGDAFYSRVKFRFTDDSECPDATMTIYRSYQVLRNPPTWKRDLTSEYRRILDVLDFGVGGFTADDETQAPEIVQVHHWVRQTREDAEAFRQFLYARRGRQKALWLPTFQPDLVPVADITVGNTTLDVMHCLYTQFVAAAANRRDIQIRLKSGTLYHRRIVSAFEYSSNVERLTLDSALPVTVTTAEIDRISFMMLARLDSDAVELSWWTDSVMEVSANFRSVKDGV